MNRPPVRGKTDFAAVAAAALEKLAAICLALPEATQDADAHHATFRVRKKTFAYYLDNHHGDGIIAACVKAPKTGKGNGASLIKGDPKRFYSPQYMGHNGWVGIRVDAKRVDWKDVGRRVRPELSRAQESAQTGTELGAPLRVAAPGRAEPPLRRADGPPGKAPRTRSRSGGTCPREGG